MNQQNKRERWTNILKQQQQTGLSIKQFCTEQNINYQTFYYWAKKLFEASAQQTPECWEC